MKMKVRAFLLTGFLLLVFAAAAQAKSVKRKTIALPEKVQVAAEAAEPPADVIEIVAPQSLDTPADEVQAEADNTVQEALNAALTDETMKIPSRLPAEAKPSTDNSVGVMASTTSGASASATSSTSISEASTAIAASNAMPAANLSAMSGANAKESEIPVLSKAVAKTKSEGSPYPRVLFSFLIIGIVAGGLVYFGRWYSKSTKKSADNNRIRVLNQHFFGPKKSLAIVRVAGETVLIGITDQNISLLKSLSLLDEELPEATPAHFATAMTTADRAATSNVKAQATGDEGPDEFLIGNIRDKISAKLKGMRNI
jgi:flagellar protein FliO/FliZ